MRKQIPDTACPVCGARLVKNAKFCIGCGALLTDSPAPVSVREPGGRLRMPAALTSALGAWRYRRRAP